MISPNSLRVLVGTLLASVLAGRGEAQAPDLVDLSVQYLPTTSLPGTVGRGQITAYDLAVNVPVPLAERSFLIPGVAYHVDAVSFENAAEELDDFTALHGLDVGLLFVQLLPRNWSLTLRSAFGIGGDQVRFGRGMYRFNALALANHAFGDTLVLGGGAIATYRFGQFLVLPALFLQWTPLEQFRFEVFLPAFARATYRPHPRVEIAARFDINGNSYAIRGAAARDAYPCQGQEEDDPSTPQDERMARPAECLDSVAYSIGTAGLSVSVRLFATVWLNIAGGYTAFRRLGRTNSQGNSLGSDESLPNTGFARVGLTWRLPIPEEEPSSARRTVAPRF